MKTTIVLIVALFALSIPAQAQKKVYVRDSVQSATTISTAAQVIRTAQGYGIARYLKTARNASSALANYSPIFIQIVHENVMDSIKIQGTYNKGTATDETDSTWTDLWVKPIELQPVTSQFTVANTVPMSLRDTTVRWLSPVTTDKMTYTVDLSGFSFARYRVVTGAVDSGKVRLMYTLKED